MKRSSRTAGFTFIEVLIAMAIFTIAVVAAVDISAGSVRATREAREMSVATWLLQRKMVELETRLETDGFEKGCDKKDDGKFPEPHQNYTWKTSCDEVDFKISETASKLAAASEGREGEESAATTENQILKMILKTAGEYITQSMRELHVEVSWQSGKNTQSVDATTHFARYDQKVGLGGVAGGTGTDQGGSTGGTSGTGGTTQ